MNLPKFGKLLQSKLLQSRFRVRILIRIQAGELLIFHRKIFGSADTTDNYSEYSKFLCGNTLHQYWYNKKESIFSWSTSFCDIMIWNSKLLFIQRIRLNAEQSRSGRKFIFPSDSAINFRWKLLKFLQGSLSHNIC